MSHGTALRKYFEKDDSKSLPIGTFGILFAAGMLLLAGISMPARPGTLINGCSLVFIVPAAVLILWSAARLRKGRLRSLRRLAEADVALTDADAQDLLDAGLERIKKMAMSSLGFTEEDLESDLLTVIAPCSDLETSADGAPKELLARKGDDGQLRFSAYRLAIIALTGRRFGLFSCTYNFIEDRALGAQTVEYQYRDIVSVSTGEESRSLQFPSGESLSVVQDFRVSIPNGEAVRIVVDSPEIRRLAGDHPLPVTGAEKAVRAIRAQLRVKEVG